MRRAFVQIFSATKNIVAEKYATKNYRCTLNCNENRCYWHLPEFQSADHASAMSYWIQMDCLRILDGTYGSLELIHTYTAFGLSSIICQNGYLMIPGVLYSTPASRNRFFCFCCDPERLCTPGPLYISLHPGQKSDPV